MAKAKKALKQSKPKSVAKGASKAKSAGKRTVAPAKKHVMSKGKQVKSSAKLAQKTKSKAAKPKVAGRTQSKPLAKTPVNPVKRPLPKAVEAKLKKPADKPQAKVHAPAKSKAESEKDARLARLKAVAEQMAKAKAAQAASAPVIDPKKGGKKPARTLTAKEKALVKEFERRELSPADAEARRNRLRNLVMLGKERSYLTYAEINDHLPDEMLDAEQLETIIGMINDMGIQVYDEAPDAETLLMSETTPPVADEEAVAEAEAALSTVDSEFGRTTDPVRMYMREMGSVELLTREGEIEIAKRIEDGLKHMVQAISACPSTISEILSLAERIEKDGVSVPRFARIDRKS